MRAKHDLFSRCLHIENIDCKIYMSKSLSADHVVNEESLQMTADGIDKMLDCESSVEGPLTAKQAGFSFSFSALNYNVTRQ